MLRTISLFLFCLLVLLSAVDQALAGKRVALVIGNAAYANAPLKNPGNDATDMAKVLTEMDFEVIRKVDADHRTMLDAMDQFYRKLQQAEVGLLYYSGHGMQVDGMNYLIPIGYRVANINDIKWEAVPAGRILGKMEDAGNKLNIVILDACRNNPFRRLFRSAQNGLASMDAPDGTIVAYATSPGSVAMDGTGRNGTYTSHLLKNLNRSDLSVLQLFNRTGLDVKQESNGKQTPWMTNSPIETYYLAEDSVVEEEQAAGGAQVENRTHGIGGLEVDSQPPGAGVYVDGKKMGTTPFSLNNLSQGRKLVRVEKEGFAPEEKEVTITSGSSSSVSFVLSPAVQHGWLTKSPSRSGSDDTVPVLNSSPRHQPGLEREERRNEVKVIREVF